MKSRTFYKGKLVTWYQRRCKRCQRFLSVRQEKYCTRCKPIANLENIVAKKKERYDKDPIAFKEHHRVYVKQWRALQ